jgi:hypothetical protein
MAEPQGSDIPWPPPGLPHDACVFQLEANSKRPPFGFMGAHHRATPWQQALLVPGPAASYGIRLDGQYLLVDFDVDSPEAMNALASLPPTWSQRSRRGPHLLYRPPPNFVGKNCDWYVDGVKFGQLKINGYGVGLGSTVDGHIYTAIDGRDPQPAPQALLDYCATALITHTGTLNSRDLIAMGERDNELTSIAGFFRRHGYTEEAIQTALWGIVRSGLVEQPLGNEILQKDCVRIAHSAMKWAAEIPMGPLTPGAWRSAKEVELVGPPVEWLILDFIPKNELSLVYGDGGCGKSSWGGWLASEVTNRHGSFIFAGIEEPFERFAQRAVQGGALEERLFDIPQAYKLRFPRDADALEEALMLAKPTCLYFDSIMSHFPPGNDGTNIAERTRHVLGSLSGVAQRTGVTIVGIFHENKAGEYSGSTEMRNVARYLLHAQREEGADRMTLAVEKYFIRDPKLLAIFIGEEVVKMDPGTGRVQYEIRNGEKTPFKHTLVRRGDDIPSLSKAAKKKAKTTKVKGSVNLGELGEVDKLE